MMYKFIGLVALAAAGSGFFWPPPAALEEGVIPVLGRIAREIRHVSEDGETTVVGRFEEVYARRSDGSTSQTTTELDTATREVKSTLVSITLVPEAAKFIINHEERRVSIVDQRVGAMRTSTADIELFRQRTKNLRRVQHLGRTCVVKPFRQGQSGETWTDEITGVPLYFRTERTLPNGVKEITTNEFTQFLTGVEPPSEMFSVSIEGYQVDDRRH